MFNSNFFNFWLRELRPKLKASSLVESSYKITDAYQAVRFRVGDLVVNLFSFRGASDFNLPANSEYNSYYFVLKGKIEFNLFKESKGDIYKKHNSFGFVKNCGLDLEKRFNMYKSQSYYTEAKNIHYICNAMLINNSVLIKVDFVSKDKNEKAFYTIGEKINPSKTEKLTITEIKKILKDVDNHICYYY